MLLINWKLCLNGVQFFHQFFTSTNKFYLISRALRAAKSFTKHIKNIQLAHMNFNLWCDKILWEIELRAEREEKKLCPESRRSIQIRESPIEENAIRFAHYWWPESGSACLRTHFIIYFPPRDNVSLLRALKAISEFVVDRLLVQFINLF